MDDFMFLAEWYEATMFLRQSVDAPLTRMELLRDPKKGIWTPTQVGDHLGLTIDFDCGDIRAP
jgi:hypothetical protein